MRRATRRRDGRPVVLKSPPGEHPSAREVAELEFEHRILRRLQLPDVVQALDLEKAGMSVVLVLEDFGGREVPVGPGALGLESFFDVAIRAAATLGQIHERGIVHKNITPKSLLRNPDTGQVKIVDFRLASELSRERQDAGSLSDLRGTLPYVSPEQTGRMNRELDYRSDYYSLGITFFELLTGRLPFQASDAMGWIHCHLSKRAPQACRINPDVPVMVSEIVGKLMAKDPDARYQSSFGLVGDLQKCRDQWKRSGAVDPFPLAADDVSERFHVSQRLFGRDREVAVLLEAFEQASQGPAKLLLVSGYSGIGKSSLIQEIHKPIVSRRGNFASGKFDQLERNVPYAAILQALRRLVRNLLGEADQSLADWKRSLTTALGANAQVMVDLVPELEEIMGPQPPAAPLGPSEAQHRFKRVFREFIKVFARPDHPLVLFLDDLQWIDASTPTVLADLLTTGEIRHLLIIGAYRENEVHDKHLLPLCLRDIRERRLDATQEVRLRPLDEGAIRALVAETLRCKEEDARSLAGVIFEKTEGNPFFTSELLSSLHRDGVFVFHAATGRWTWDLDSVRAAAVTEDVADLMVLRLQRLPDSSIDALKVAACIGNQFDLAAVARASGKTRSQVASALWEPIVQRIVIPLDGDYRLNVSEDAASRADSGARYRFQHDRVQQAAYSLIDDERRPVLHLAIARLLRSWGGAEVDREEHLFDLVNHFNLGSSAIVDPAERAELSALNFTAGQRAKRSAAYAIAADYLEKSVGALESGGPATDGRAAFDVLRERAECVHLAGDPERAARLCDDLFDVAPDLVARGIVSLLKIRTLEHQGKLREAVAAARTALASFGIQLPEDHAEIDRRIGEGIGKMQEHLGRTTVEGLLDLPPMADPEKVMAMNLLFQVIPSAIQTYPPLFVLAELWMFDLALQFGTTAASCKNFVDCGIIQGGILGNYDVAYRLGQVAFKLLERYAPTPLESAVHFVFAAFVSHWRAPHQESFQSFATAHRLGLESGDIEHVAYTSVHHAHRMLYVGKSLLDCEADNRSAVSYLTRMRARGQLAGLHVSVRGVARLVGSDGDREASLRADDEALAALEQMTNAQWLFSFGACQAMVSFLLGDLEAADRWQRLADQWVAAGTGLASLPDYYLFQGLILARKHGRASKDERDKYLSVLKDNQQKLEAWARNCEDNYAHKYHLLSAEIARLEGRPLEEVLPLYERAIVSAGAAFTHMVALTHELEGEFWLERGHARTSKMLQGEAYQLYAQWGARAKLAAMEQHHPGAFAAPERSDAGSAGPSLETGAGTGSALDLASVLKTTRAISGEVRTEKLFTTLMNAILENAGAQRGCLVLRGESHQRLRVEAFASVEGGKEVKPSAPLDSAPVCADIIRYVMRTRETVVLDDAARKGPFQTDPYVQENDVKSVLCMPVLNRGSLVAVLYAENNAVASVFTKERLVILDVVASQAAVSITNALLYDNLEHTVEERTLELAQKNREIAAMLHGMQQGVFTIGGDLGIEPQYSKHLEQIVGTPNIAGQSCLELLFRASTVRPDALSAMEAALRFSFGLPAVLAESNMSHLVREFERTDPDGRTCFFEIDWAPILDAKERIVKVLVVVRDVTLVRELKATALKKSRESEIVSQVLDAGLDALRDFCEGSRSLLDENRAILGSGRELTEATVRALFRNVHTIKGNARLLGFNHLVDAVHDAEGAFDELRRGEFRGANESRLLGCLDAVASVIDEYEGTCRTKLGFMGNGQTGRLVAAVAEIERLVDQQGTGAERSELARQIGEALRGVRAVPLVDVVKETSRIIPSLARELDKSVPEIECDTAGTVLCLEWADVMRDVFVQCFRNALAHGIESSKEREAAGKAPRGRIRLRTERADKGVRVRLSDDGKGLALDALRERLGQRNGADEELVDTMFSAGVSTAANLSRVSGRGVGMDIVRSSVTQHGGEVGIVFTGDTKQGFRPFELVVTLPPDALVAR